MPSYLPAYWPAALQQRAGPYRPEHFHDCPRDNGPAASLGALKAAAFKEAGAFCACQAKTMQVTKESDTPRSLGQFPQTTLQFQCN